MEKVVQFTPEVEFFINDLIDILFFEDYFSYIENSKNYSSDLKLEIEKYIEFKKHLITPKKLVNYGLFYITVSLNKRTTWFVFFDKKDSRYLIQFITNNHMEDSKILNL